MRAEVIDTAERLESIEPRWRSLLAETAGDTVFLGWDWIVAWWGAYGAPHGHALHVVALHDGDEWVGLAPLYLARPARPAPWLGTTLRFLGTGGDTSPDHLNVAVRPGREEEVARALAGALAEGPWDALHLTDMDADAPMTVALERALEARLGLCAPLARTPGAVCPYVDLPATPAELHNRLPRKLRYNLRSRWKKLASEGARAFLWDGPAREGIARLAELHTARFSARGGRHGFQSAEYLAFHQDVAERFQRSGALRLFCLAVRDRVVAMLYCFRHGETVYHFQSGFDPAWSKAGVGQALVAHAVEHAVIEGARRFDFLKGEYAYKDDWATGRRRTCTLTAGRLGPRGLAHLYRSYLRPTLSNLTRGGISP